MDSGEENDMVERFRGADLGLKGDKGPTWNGKKKTWAAFWYKQKVFLKLCNGGRLEATVDGADIGEKQSDDEKVRDGYKRRNLLVWRYMHRSVSDVTVAGQSLLMMIEDDFGEDNDGYELILYFKAYAAEQTDTDVEKEWKRIKKMSFKMNESPSTWEHGFQLLRKNWNRIPDDMRGGGDKQLITLLLKKVGKANQSYVAFVRAMLFVKDGEGKDDYQAIAKVLIEQHKQFYKGGSDYGGSSEDDEEGAKKATTKRNTRGDAAGAAAFTSWAAPAGGKKLCGRCGAEGHFKRDCKATCKRCGLQCCGGVRDPKRCMTCEGIQPSFRKIMEKNQGSKEAIVKIEKRAKEMGIAKGNVMEAEAEVMTADQIDEFFLEGQGGAEAEADTLYLASVETEVAMRVRGLLTSPEYGTTEELVPKMTDMLMQAGEEHMLQAMEMPEVFECMALECLEQLGATRDDESSDDEQYKGQETSEACAWYTKGALALQESKLVRRSRSDEQWEAMRTVLGERGLRLQPDGSWYPPWDDRSEAGYHSGGEAEAQALQAAMLNSLQESVELEQAMEASMETATAMEPTPSEKMIAEQEDDQAMVESVMTETERVEGELWADEVWAQAQVIEADVQATEAMERRAVIQLQEAREEMLEARRRGTVQRSLEEEVSVRRAIQASLGEATTPPALEESESMPSPDSVTCVDRELHDVAEWYTVQVPGGDVTVEAVRGSDEDEFFTRLGELGATVQRHGKAGQGQTRAYRYAYAQMSTETKAATARGAALDWAMQGAERWAAELNQMDLDNPGEEQCFHEIEEIMDSGGPELEEILDGGDGGAPDMLDELMSGLAGETHSEPSMAELEMVTELAEHTNMMVKMAEEEATLEAATPTSKGRGRRRTSNSSAGGVVASFGSPESWGLELSGDEPKRQQTVGKEDASRQLNWMGAESGEGCEQQMGYSKTQRARLYANPSSGNGAARGSSHGLGAAASVPPKQRFKRGSSTSCDASASMTPRSQSESGGARAKRFSPPNKTSPPNLSGSGRGPTQPPPSRQRGGREHWGSSGVRTVSYERDRHRRREQGGGARMQGTAAGWVRSACITVAGMAAIAVLAMLGAGAQSTAPTHMTQQSAAWHASAVQPDASCLMMETGGQSAEGEGEIWAVLDRGCTHTAFYQIEAFDRATLHTPAIRGVRVGSGQRLEVKHQGTVVLEVNDTSNRTVIYRRPNVLYVPGLHRNLISERQEWELYRTRIVGEDVNVMHLPTTRWVQRTRAAEARPAVEMRAVPIRNKDGLYAIRGRPATATGEAAAAMATWRDVTPAQMDAYKKWHARMGDAHPEKMKLMAEHTQGTPLQTVPVTAAAKAAGVCPHCARGKMRRGHVGVCKHRPTKLMEQTQIDWWGPFSVKSVPGGYIYAAVVVDVATGWVQVYLRRTHTSADAIDVLTLYEGDMGSGLQCVRTDGDSNFVSDEMQMWLANKKVTWQKSTPYVHEEMGHVERRNGMLVPIARTTLLRARMRLVHWGDAILHACWILNRTPDSSHGDDVMTPYERRHGKKPDLSNVRVFGAKAWAFLDKDQRQTKMDEVAVEGRWVGFAPNGAHWLVYANGRHYHTRWAKVDETNVGVVKNEL